MNKWIKAFRLRTLPLALSSVFMGAIVAYGNGFSNLEVLDFAILTTLFLQILSNLANDYGDFLKGTDNDQRIGPARTMQTGLINKISMRNAIIIFVVLSFISGVLLIVKAFEYEMLLKSLLFLFIGIVAIWAAIKYTVGKRAYGYSGLGDLFVFFFSDL
jgi:1,4-dihydroxy-2-naphthoate octaprenyltransferase